MFFVKSPGFSYRIRNGETKLKIAAFILSKSYKVQIWDRRREIR